VPWSGVACRRLPDETDTARRDHIEAAGQAAAMKRRGTGAPPFGRSGERPSSTMAKCAEYTGAHILGPRLGNVE
jgi:hypothetical protein